MYCADSRESQASVVMLTESIYCNDMETHESLIVRCIKAISPAVM